MNQVLAKKLKEVIHNHFMMANSYSEIESQIAIAINAIAQGVCANVAEAAQTYNVPVSRLRKRWKGCQSRSKRPGAGKKLTDAEELAICKYLDRLDEIGVAARYSMLAPCANSLLRSNHLDTSTPSSTVSNKWPQQFLKRYPQYAIRRQKTLDLHRKNAHRPDELQAWFERFHHLYVEKGIQPEDCNNMDETGFQIGIGKDQWSITKDRDRPLYLPSANNRDLITAVECVSAVGNVILGVLHQQA